MGGLTTYQQQLWVTVLSFCLENNVSQGGALHQPRAQDEKTHAAEPQEPACKGMSQWDTDAPVAPGSVGVTIANMLASTPCRTEEAGLPLPSFYI